jgi:hypothetical protein
MIYPVDVIELSIFVCRYMMKKVIMHTNLSNAHGFKVSYKLSR